MNDNRKRTKFKIYTKRFFKYLLEFPSLPYWIMAFVASVLAVAYSLIFKWAELLVSMLVSYNQYLFLIITPIGFLLAWAIVYFFAPSASGSGIPQVMAMIDTSNDNKKTGLWNGMLGVKTTLIKILSSFICIFVGGAIGREGPTVQISAGVFNVMGTKLKRIFKNISHESLLVAGGSAGIAAAFDTPLGGIVYGIEELSKTHVKKIKTDLITAVIIAGMTAQWILGSYLYLGDPNISRISSNVFPWVILISILGGLAGGMFGKTLYLLLTLKNKIKKKRYLALIALSAGLIFAIIAITFEIHTFGSGKELMTEMLFEQPSGSFLVELKLFIARFIGPLLSQVTGAAGGIFAPSLATGGTIGSVISYFTDYQFHSLFVILGMISFLTGVTRVPFTCFVLVLEMTGVHSVIFYMMITAILSNLCASIIDKESFYERIKLNFISNSKNV